MLWNIGITVETLGCELDANVFLHPLEYKCESHNSPSRIFVKTGDGKPMVGLVRNCPVGGIMCYTIYQQYNRTWL